jgi:hypothetical protein
VAFKFKLLSLALSHSKVQLSCTRAFTEDKLEVHRCVMTQTLSEQNSKEACHSLSTSSWPRARARVTSRGLKWAWPGTGPGAAAKPPGPAWPPESEDAVHIMIIRVANRRSDKTQAFPFRKGFACDMIMTEEHLATRMTEAGRSTAVREMTW